MEEKKKINPKIKLALAILLPVIIMSVTIAMVGTSFAWFSRTLTPSVSTIDMTTKEVFTLVFENSNKQEDVAYAGQTAFKNSYKVTNGKVDTTSSANYLINSYRNTAYGYDDKSTYIEDAPFSFWTTFNVDTQNKKIDFNIDFNRVKIQRENSTIVDGITIKTTSIYELYGENDTTLVPGNTHTEPIPLVFTWYLKRSGDDAIYTPYGKLKTKTESGITVADTLNGADATNLTLSSLTRDGIKEFITSGPEQVSVYVVFCPEKLYWSQYFKKDRDKSLEQLYTTAEISKIVGADSTTSVYYSASKYWGCQFQILANMSVSKIYEEEV